MPSDFNARAQATILHVGGVASGASTTDEQPLIVGMADPFSTIDVFDGTALLGVVSSNGQGHWTLQLSTPLDNGIHDLSAVQVNGYGVNSTASYFAITVDGATGLPSFENEGALFLDNARQAASEAANAAPFFPPNLFGSHAASAAPSASDHTGPAQDVPAIASAGEDSNSDAQSFVRQTSTQTGNGKGFDMVAFLGDHQVVDLSALTDKSLGANAPGIGGFDLGGHHNALVLSLSDVLNFGEQDLFIDDGKHQLIVNGKEGDSVDLTNSHVPGLTEGDWQHHGTTEVGGVMYNVVEHSSANTELLVEQHVRIEVH